MSVATFHPPTPDAVRHIGDHLRQADRIELAITDPGRDVQDVLAAAVRESRWCVLVKVDDVPAILYGVAPTADPHVGHAWMLATRDIHKVRREFVERCRGEVRLMQQRFAVLTNRVHAGNTLAIRWLEWLGFTVDHEHPRDGLLDFWKGRVIRCAVPQQ